MSEMTARYPNSKQFKKDLDNNRLENVYLFLGEEAGEKDKFISRILDLVFKDANERGNSTGRFHVENDEFMPGADFALSSSMFYSSKVCILYNIESLKGGKENILLFNDLMENLPDSTRIVMTTNDKRPPSFITSELIKNIKVVQFWRYFDNDIYSYIRMNTRKLGFEVDDKAIDKLIELTGKDIKKIDDALDMIKYSGETGVITFDKIENFISDVKDVSLFEFLDCLYKKDRKALKLYKKLYEEGTPNLKVLYMIIMQAEKIERFFIYINEGMSIDDAMKECRVYSKSRDDFWQYTKVFTQEKIKKVFPLISSTDYRIKSTGKTRDLVSDHVFNLVSNMLLQV